MQIAPFAGEITPEFTATATTEHDLSPEQEAFVTSTAGVSFDD